MVKRQKVESYIEKLYCDKCGREMKPTGLCYSTYPEQYEYRCECGQMRCSTKRFPQIVYETVPGSAEEVVDE